MTLIYDPIEIRQGPGNHIWAHFFKNSVGTIVFSTQKWLKIKSKGKWTQYFNLVPSVIPTITISNIIPRKFSLIIPLLKILSNPD